MTAAGGPPPGASGYPGPGGPSGPGAHETALGGADGLAADRQGSTHRRSSQRHGPGIVGAQVSLGTGLGFSNWYRENDRVSLTYFGEGASNQGQVYESFNLANLMKLPVVFIIENNRYAMGTSVERSSASRDLSLNGVPWGMPSLAVDGMDVLAVKAAGELAVAHCRAGKGPFLLEMKTYRYRGHSMSDPAKYRTREEVQRMRAEHDSLDSAKKHLEELGITEAALKQLDDEIKARVQEAADFAQASPEPDPAELWTDILVGV